MKHLIKFNESVSDIEQDILDNFQLISDKFGDPVITSQNWSHRVGPFANSATNSGGMKKWTIKWNLGINIGAFNDAAVTIDKLKSIVDELDDILSAKDRMVGFNFYMSISDSIIINVVPKDTGSDKFNFISRQEGRGIFINMVDIERFFASKGLIISNKEEKDDEGYEQSSIIITINLNTDKEIVYSATTEFKRMFMIEYNLAVNSNKIDRDIDCTASRNVISIYPLQEKTYLLFN